MRRNAPKCAKYMQRVPGGRKSRKTVYVTISGIRKYLHSILVIFAQSAAGRSYAKKKTLTFQTAQKLGLGLYIPDIIDMTFLYAITLR